jgi:hypothetical protein
MDRAEEKKLHINMTPEEAMAWDPFGQPGGGEGPKEKRPDWTRIDREDDRKNAAQMRNAQEATKWAIRKDEESDNLWARRSRRR